MRVTVLIIALAACHSHADQKTATTPAEASNVARTPPATSGSAAATHPATAVDAAASPPSVAGVTPMVSIPAGPYPVRVYCDKTVTVNLSGFRIDQDEVTQRQYAACVEATRCQPSAVAPVDAKDKNTPGNLDEPVRGVSWNDASAYCAFVNKRLPTQLEWMRTAFRPKADASGDAENAPPIVNDSGRKACDTLVLGGYDKQRCGGGEGKTPLFSEPEPVTVALLAQHHAAWNGNQDAQDLAEPAPGVNVYDLYGNVAEWVSDWEAYPQDPAFCTDPNSRTDPKGPAHRDKRVIKGGSFKALEGARYAEDRSEAPTAKPVDVGFRCAAEL